MWGCLWFCVRDYLCDFCMKVYFLSLWICVGVGRAGSHFLLCF